MAENSQRRRWGRNLTEGVLIVASILLAFGIEAWWSGYNERKDEVEALGYLREDFIQTDQRLTSSSERHRKIFDGSVRLLHMTGPTAPVQIDELTVDTLVMNLLDDPMVFPVTATLDALMGSGRLNILSSSELRRELAAWAAVMDTLLEREREGKMQMDQRFLPLIWDYVPVVTLDLVGLPEEYSGVDLAPSRFSRRYDAMLTERRFENAVEERMNTSRRALEHIDVAQEMVAKILLLLNRELGR